MKCVAEQEEEFGFTQSDISIPACTEFVLTTLLPPASCICVVNQKCHIDEPMLQKEEKLSFIFSFLNHTFRFIFQFPKFQFPKLDNPYFTSPPVIQLKKRLDRESTVFPFHTTCVATGQTSGSISLHTFIQFEVSVTYDNCLAEPAPTGINRVFPIKLLLLLLVIAKIY